MSAGTFTHTAVLAATVDGVGRLGDRVEVEGDPRRAAGAHVRVRRDGALGVARAIDLNIVRPNQ